MPKPHLFEILLDRPIAFHRCFVHLTHSITAALLLSQAVYWSKRTKDSTGWFFKTAQEWHEETGLSRRESDTARQKLRNLSTPDLPPFWFEELRGLPARQHFRLDFDALRLHLEALDVPPEPVPPSVQTSLADSAKLAKPCTKAPNKFGGIRLTSLAESAKLSITETTTETTSRRGRARTRVTPAASSSSARRPSPLSRYSRGLILNYLDQIKGKLRDNGGLAHKLWLTGEDDHLIERWHQSQASPAAPDQENEMISMNLETAGYLLSKPALTDVEKQWLPAIIENLATRPALTATVAQLKGLL